MAKIVGGNQFLRRMLLTILLGISAVCGQDSLQISQTQLEIRSDTLRGSWAVSGLVSGDIRQTLLSGLPILIEVNPQLLRDPQAAVSPRPLRYRCYYDIWEDLYVIESADQVYQLNTMDEFIDWWQKPPAFSFFAISDIRQEIRLRLRLQVNVTLLTRKQDRQLRSWVLNSSQNEEQLPSSERDTGFTLNLNAVLSIFIDKDAPLQTFQREATSSDFIITQSATRQ